MHSNKLGNSVFSRLKRTLSGSEVRVACELDGSPFAIAILRVSANESRVENSFWNEVQRGSIPIT